MHHGHVGGIIDAFEPRHAVERLGQFQDLPVRLLFPGNGNRAPLEMILRVPGIGARRAYKITTARRYASLSFDDLSSFVPS